MNKFEKISFEQFSKDIKEDINLYNEYNIPKRATKGSAGYDFELVQDTLFKKGEVTKVPTGIKCKMNNNIVLLLIVRSSIGIKKRLVMMNQTGVVDSDYYNNEDNEGHMYAFLKNDSEEDVFLKKGERFLQGILMPFVLADEEEVVVTRTGGTGSTNKE